ncbi:MAG: hypothetical protein A2284_05475 [Deltaproteobacteria bacterium RIFOXYA12_FULL_61_11]|nr:MAG: hypothetical protein A2284_05475 [Deltaproteobacteria bacterium RIFOXYA12_FULL_61_11]
MDQKTLLAIVLCVIIWIVFMPSPSPRPPQPANTSAPAAASPEAEAVLAPHPTEVQPAPSTIEDRVFTLRNDRQEVEVGSIGGRILRVRLKDFATELGKETRVVLDYGSGSEVQRPLNWVFKLDQGDRIVRLRNLGYVVRTEEPDHAVLEYDFEGLLTFTKRLALVGDYGVRETIDIANHTSGDVRIVAECPLHYELPATPQSSGGCMRMMGQVPDIPNLVVRVNETIERAELASLEATRHFEGRVGWMGVDSKYFLSVIRPTLPLAQSLEFTKEGNRVSGLLRYGQRDLLPGQQVQFETSMWAGPKEIERLQTLGDNLEATIDLGDWLGPLARPILKLLRWIHSIVPNYGLAIILLTILVKLLLFPLNVKQYKSMKAMQKLQPEIKLLRERFQDSKEKLNAEMMDLFKRHKVNPMGGCLPLLLQMPIFFALYRVLFNSIELRHEPFAFWIVDLSSPDQYFISPLLMGVMMFIQQRMTPTTTMDPTQAKMLQFMPVIFTLFMLALPSGLVIYILTNTMVSILQQWWINKRVTV